MANSTSGRITTVVENFWSSFTRGDDLERVGKLMSIVSPDAASIKVTNLATTGSGGFTSSWGGTASPTVKDFTATAGSAVTPAAYAKRMVLEKYTAADNPDILADIGVKMGQEAQYKLAGLAYTALAGVFSADHPIQAGKKVVDTLANIDNSASAALSASTLKTARSVMRQGANTDGDIVGMAPSNLVCPAELESTAKEIVFSSAFGTGAGNPNLLNTLNPLTNSGIVGVQVIEQLSDANNWFLVADASMNPNRAFAKLWLRDGIEFIVSEVEATKQLSFHVSFRAVVYYPPECELGIYGSIVA